MKIKDKPKVTLQSESEFYAAFYGKEMCGGEQTATLEEIDMSINDCKILLEYSIDRGDKEEISYWRKMLQENKVQRRKMLTA